MHTRQSPSYTEYAPLVVQPQPIHQWETAPETFTPPQYPPNRAQIIRTPSPTPSEQNQLEGKLPYSKGKMLKMYWRAYTFIFYLTRRLPSFRRGFGRCHNHRRLHRYFCYERQDRARSTTRQVMDGRVSKVLSSYPHSTNIACRRPWGFVIPLAIYVVISFPPLIGQEIVATFCGMIWGLGEGFGIVAAGTIIGEILLFTYACPSNDLLARTDPLIMQRRQVLLQREAADEGEKQCILRLLR